MSKNVKPCYEEFDLSLVLDHHLNLGHMGGSRGNARGLQIPSARKAPLEPSQEGSRGFQGSFWGGFQRLLASAYLLFRFSKRFFLNVVEGSEKGLNENQAFFLFLLWPRGFHRVPCPEASRNL